ncbi:hypothetical protein ANANG_G00052500 [Anguilla anguilla]|uniref:Bcl-x interacting BH3 domain-containing protein n=1 Tax=Anguilla anguilla TaxID=7936 RepID=A0A9D3MUZ9_ANGAN|nr:hypothetical protein ANANG_G00052500 [Anguilla anguilla]
MSRGQTQSNGRTLADAGGPGPGPGPADPSASGRHREGEPKRGGASRDPSDYPSSPALCSDPSTASSGCLSFDHPRPDFPLTADSNSIQTASPSGQTVYHTQPRSAQDDQNQEQQNLQNHEAYSVRPSGGGVLQPEHWVGQELRRIGDEMNQEYTGRGRSRYISHSLYHWLALLVGRLLQILFRCR